MRLQCLVVLGAVLLTPLGAACTHDAGDVAVADDDLTGSIGVGTYLVDARPFGTTYLARVTFAAGQKLEADVVSGSGNSTLLAGSYSILPARPNDPHSPISTDKPTLVISGDTGLSFEFDKLPGGALRLYTSARQASFTMKIDPTWRPAPTNGKVIACSGNAVDAKLTLDQAQNRRGTFAIVRKASADDHDPPTVTVSVMPDQFSNAPDRLYFEGHHGEQDFYVNMLEDDFARGTGAIPLNMRWAQNGQEWSIGGTCAFSR
jgi:hypothetical protein